MADFQVTITNPTTSEVAITDSNDTLTIVDYSNYDDGDEPGHDQSDFSDFRKLKIVLPNGDSYLFSSIGDGDEDLEVPSEETLPISTSYAYSQGDGTYYVYLYVLPTWDAAAAYLLADTPYVYYNAKMYKCLQNGTNKNPATETAYWSEVTALSSLPSKYTLSQRITLTSDLKETLARRVYNAFSVLNNSIDDDRHEQLFRNQEMIDAQIMTLLIDAIPVLIAVDDWDSVDTAINLGKQFKAKYA